MIIWFMLVLSRQAAAAWNQQRFIGAAIVN
jgi:hypothetical protein